MQTIILLAGLLLAGAPVFAQTAELRLKPIDFDNTLVLTLPDEGRALWQRAGRLLAQRGYAIRYASPDLLTLSTEAVDTRGAVTLGMALVINGHELRLQGYNNRMVLSADKQASWLEVVSYETGNGQRARQWQELERVARLLGGTVQYARAGPN